MDYFLLDASRFTHGSEAEKAQYAYDLREMLVKYGFVKLVNHGVTASMVFELDQWSRKFFHLPTEVKARIANQPGPDPQRGWSCVGAENSSALFHKIVNKEAASKRDAREHFDIGATTDLAFPNKWLTADELPGFREFMESLFETMEHVNRSILQALELGFGLPPNTFTDKCSHMGNASEFRVTHYPGISVEEMKNGHTSRIWPHTDLGVITLLLQDSVGGLEFQDRKHPSNFLPVESNNPAEMIVSVSETLQRWTNDALPAAVHRVTLPAALKGQQDGILRARYSAAYFCKADRETSVGPIKQFVGPQENGAKYADMSAIEYHKQRLATAY